MRILGIFAIIVVALTMMVGTATAGGKGAGKAPLYDTAAGFTCADGATDTAGPTFGFAVMNINRSGDLIVQASVKRGTANATYDIWVNQDPGACPLGAPQFAGALTTNRRGNGNAHVTIDPVDGAENYWVSVVGGGQVLRSQSVQLK